MAPEYIILITTAKALPGGIAIGYLIAQSKAREIYNEQLEEDFYNAESKLK